MLYNFEMLRFLFAGSLILRSWALYDPANHIESARLYGNIDEYAYWFVDLLIGTPAQRVSVILDTGSGLAAFPCASCAHCGKHIDPNFDIAKSSSAKWVPCGAGCSGRCTSGHCSYHQGYQEGSSISGWWFTDWVRLGDAIQRNPPVQARMGCHQNENKLFYTQKANGIIGVRGGSTLLTELFRDTAHVKTNIFAICLAEYGGRLVVGGHNASYHSGQLQWIPMTTTYSVTLSSMKVGPSGRKWSGFGHTMVDSGTTYTYMGRTNYRTLKSEIESYCRANGNCGASQHGNCWTIGGSGLSAFPNVEVYFGNVLTSWEPRGYLYRKGGGNNYCYSFEDDGPGAGTVLGASWMLYHEVVFDLGSNRLGIVKAECPQYQKRPTHTQNLLDPPTVPPLNAVAVPTTPVVNPITQAPGGGANSSFTLSPVSVKVLAPPVTIAPVPIQNGAVVDKKSFMSYTKIAIFAGLAALSMGFLVFCLCRRQCAKMATNREVSQGSWKKPAAVAQVVGSPDSISTVSNRAGNGQNEEENASLVRNMEKREEADIQAF